MFEIRDAWDVRFGVLVLLNGRGDCIGAARSLCSEYPACPNSTTLRFRGYGLGYLLSKASE